MIARARRRRVARRRRGALRAAAGRAVIGVEPADRRVPDRLAGGRRADRVPTPGTAMAGLDCAEVSAGRVAVAAAPASAARSPSPTTRPAPRCASWPPPGLAIGESGAAPLAALRARSRPARPRPAARCSSPPKARPTRRATRAHQRGRTARTSRSGATRCCSRSRWRSTRPCSTRRRGVVDHVRARHRRDGPARARAGDLPLGERARGGARGAADGSDRPPAGHRRRLRLAARGLLVDRARHEPRLGDRSLILGFALTGAANGTRC